MQVENVVFTVSWKVYMLGQIKRRQSRKKLKCNMVRWVVKMYIEVASDYEFMGRGSGNREV